MKKNRIQSKPIKKKTSGDDSVEYPSLREHLMSRRKFLGLAGATLAMGGLYAACNRSVGIVDGDGGVEPDGDGGVEPDGDISIPGVVEEPQYYISRLPFEGELSAYLLDWGYARFYVEVATFSAATYNAVEDYRTDCEAQSREVLEERAYEDLETGEGIAQAEDDLLEELEGLVRQKTGDSSLQIETVTLTLTVLEPNAPIDGGMPEPRYP